MQSRVRSALQARRIEAYRKRLESPVYAPLAHLPFSEDFLSGLRQHSRGIFRHKSGLFVKVGEELDKVSFRGRDSAGRKLLFWDLDRFDADEDNIDHVDYALEFPVMHSYSTQAACRAAELHARFYAHLVKGGWMLPGTKVILHDSKNGYPAITVIQPKASVRHLSYQGVITPEVAAMKEKLFAAFPGLKEMAHADLLRDDSYGRMRVARNAVAAHRYARGNAVFIHDLHIFDAPLSGKTLDWIEKTLEKKEKTQV